MRNLRQLWKNIHFSFSGGKIKAATFAGNGLNYFVFGNASSDNSLKKSCCKMILILINNRASKLFRLKMLYTFVRSQGISFANHAADLPCFLRTSWMCLPIFIRYQSWFSFALIISAAKVWNKSQYISTLLSKSFLMSNYFFSTPLSTIYKQHPRPSHDMLSDPPSDSVVYGPHGNPLSQQPESADHDR